MPQPAASPSRRASQEGRSSGIQPAAERDNRKVIGRVSSPLFVGRRDELAVLEAAVERAAGGAGAVVLIGAEAGMGKSRLVAELAALATRAGATTVIGECLPLADGELPYAPIVSALRSLLRARGEQELTGLIGVANDELVRLLPELGDHAGARAVGRA